MKVKTKVLIASATAIAVAALTAVIAFCIGGSGVFTQGESQVLGASTGGSSQIYHATSQELQGEAVAVISGNTLYYIRTTDDLSSMRWDSNNGYKYGTLNSISGGSYTGYVYDGYEASPVPDRANINNGWDYGQNVNGITAVEVVDAIRPLCDGSYLIPPSAETLDLEKMDTSQMTSMRNMFSYSQATNLDLSTFDTSGVTDFAYMFFSLTNLEYLDISNFDTSLGDSQYGGRDDFISGCSNLRTFIVGSDFDLVDSTNACLPAPYDYNNQGGTWVWSNEDLNIDIYDSGMGGVWFDNNYASTSYTNVEGTWEMTCISPKYTISYDPDYNNLSPIEVDVYSDYTPVEVQHLPNSSELGISRPGKEIVGWATQQGTQADDEGYYRDGWWPRYELQTQDSDVLYAVWADTCTLTLDANCAQLTGQTYEMTCIDGEYCSIPDMSYQFVREGYAIKGWSLSSGNNNSVDYTVDGGLTLDQDLTLYAVWDVADTLTIYPNIGNLSGIDSSMYGFSETVVSKPQNSSVNLASCGVSYDLYNDDYAYIPCGYNTQANGSGTSYPSNGTYQLSSEVNDVLYVQWEPRIHLMYNPNLHSIDNNVTTADDVSNSVEHMNNYVTASGCFELSDIQTEVPAGYYFVGWNTSADGLGTVLYPNMLVNGTRTGSTLYAQYSNDPDDVVFGNDYICVNVISDEGSQIDWNSIESGSFVVTNKNDVVLATLPYENYDSNGFGSVLADGTSEYTISQVKSVSGLTTLSEDIVFTVDYGPSVSIVSGKASGSGNCIDIGIEYSSGPDPYEPEPFDPNAVHLSYQPASAANPYSDWEAGSVSPASESFYPDSGSPSGSTATANSGYEFAFWTKNVHGAQQVVSRSTTYVPTGTFDADAYFLAYFEEIGTSNLATGTIRIDLNGGSMANNVEGTYFSDLLTAQEYVVGSSLNLPSKSGVTKNGYVIKGWSTSQNGIPVISYSGQYVDDYTIPSGNTVLYAVWGDPAERTVQYSPAVWDPTYGNPSSPGGIRTYLYNINPGSVSRSTESVNINSGTPSGSTATAESGYSFAFWATSDGVIRSRNASYTPDLTEYNNYQSADPLKYYAVFVADGDATTTSTLKIDLNNGNLKSNVSSPYLTNLTTGSGLEFANGSYLSMRNVSPYIERTGYTLLGYNTVANPANDQVTIGVENSFANAGTNTTLYAIWQENAPDPSTGDITVNKTINVPASVDLTGLTYTFDFQAAAPVANEEGAFAVPANVDIPTVTLTAANSTLATGNDSVRTISGTVSLPNANSFGHAGVYAYTVTETVTGANANDSWDNDLSQYKVRLYVVNDGNGGLIYDTSTNNGGTNVMTIEVLKDIDGADAGSAGSSVQAGAKVNALDFTNTYDKTVPFQVKKLVSGDYANRTHRFSFDLTLDFPDYVTSGTYAYTTSYGTNGSVTVTNGQGTISGFQLAADETLDFSALPVGTVYTVVESTPSEGVNDYVPSATYTYSGIGAANSGYETVTNNVTAGTAGATYTVNKTDGAAQNLNTILGAGSGNRVDVTNTLDNPPSATGVLVSLLPFAAILAIPAILVLGLYLTRRRGEDDEL